MKKNVLLDFNLIIKGQYDNTFKTGIYYVQYNIIKRLLNNYSDKFNFFAFCYYDKDIFYKTINNFLPELKNIKYINILSKTEKINIFLKNKIDFLRKEKKSSKNLLFKIILLSKILCLKIIKFFNPELRQNKLLNNIDIYQSFYEKIPNNVNKSLNIKKFTFIYDLLPITNPEYITIKKSSQEKIKNNCIKKINNLDKDTIIFTDSEYAKNEFLKIFTKFKNSNIIVNLLAADNKKYYKLEDLNNIKKSDVLEKYNIPIDQKYILSLCSLNKRKNLAFLVECFVDFLNKNPEIQDLNLVLAGPKGWLMDEMFNSISNASKYKDKIILAGFIDDKDINIIYNSAFTFVFPSIAEGFGLPVLEAMQCGIPVLSSNTTSLPEVYGDAALSFNPYKKNELIDCLYNIYYDVDLRVELIKKGFKQSQKFSWNKTVDKIVYQYLK